MNLTSDQQSALVAQAQAGNSAAQNQLLRFCERDIQGMIRKHSCSAADKEDLAQVGRMAVMKAIPKFKGDAGKQFRFYAAEWAREDIRRVATTLSSMVPRNVRTRGSQDVMLDAPVTGEGGDETSLYELMESDNSSPEELLISHDEATNLRIVLERTTKALQRQNGASYDRLGLCQALVKERLLAPDPIKLDTLAQKYRVARETVRKLEAAIINTAKSMMQEASYGV